MARTAEPTVGPDWVEFRLSDSVYGSAMVVRYRFPEGAAMMQPTNMAPAWHDFADIERHALRDRAQALGEAHGCTAGAGPAIPRTVDRFAF